MAGWTTWSGAGGFTSSPNETLVADVEESYAHFIRHFGRPAGFSSPGFYSDERVMLLLDRLGFAYNGDGIGGEPHRATAGGRTAAPLDHSGDSVRAAHDSVPRVPRRPRHAPGGGDAPLDEHLDARDEVILYGHPCYEGVREGVLRQVFARVVERGFRFVTMQTLAERLQAATPTR